MGGAPFLWDSASGAAPGGVERRRAELPEGNRRNHSAGKQHEGEEHRCRELPWRSDDWGVEQGLTGGEVLIGDIPATRLRGGAGDEEREGLDRELRHLETGGGGKKVKLAC